jgi:Flp pilus assembly protein protease CpaA
MILPHALLLVPIAVLLFFAGWSDIVTRTIPNSVCLGLAVLGLAVRAIAGLPAVAASAAAAGLLFILLALAHARGAFGGGDVKLIAATALGLPLLMIPRFLVVTVIAGGVLALLHLMLRRVFRNLPLMPPPARGTALLRRVLIAERWRIARRGPLPYGVAIAFGGIWAVITGPGG